MTIKPKVLVGILTSPEDYPPNAMMGPVYYNTDGVLTFQLKAVPLQPIGDTDRRHYSVFAELMEKFGFENDTSIDPNIRKEKLYDILCQYIFVFEPVTIPRVNKSGEVKTVRDLRCFPKPPNFNPNTPLYTFPIFSREKQGYDYEEFLARLQKNKPLGNVLGVSTDKNHAPSFVLWEHSSADYVVIGDFQEQTHNEEEGFRYYFENLKVVPFDPEWPAGIILDRDNSLCFIDHNTLFKIDNALLDTDAFQFLSETTPLTINTERTKEDEFLDYFKQRTIDRGLTYSNHDLINFHTAMKTSNLVILAGMSGTGKSQLVHAYADALGLPSEQKCFIPVRPSWSDDSDLIGYVDTMQSLYRPAESGLTNILIEAANNKQKLYIVCFDEMNLARVEHYFSQFLSVLEMPAEERKLRLYNKELHGRLHNSTLFPEIIPLHGNVLFVGTANLDESTYHFSDKVLDRSNVIKLEVNSFKSLIGLKPALWKPSSVEISSEEYNSFKNKDEEISLEDNHLKFFDSLHEALRSVNADFGIGYRIVRQIDQFMKNLPKSDSLSVDHAFDLQIVQRIMTKLRGSEEQLKPLVGRWSAEENRIVNGKLLKVLDDHGTISYFKKTREVIEQKERELRFNGYTV